jgi:hypothetical protein
MCTQSISAKPQQRSTDQRLSPILANFGDLKAFFLFFCFDFLHIDPSKNVCFCKFFAKGLKSEEDRLKVKFWSLEMVKIGRGQ